MNLRLYWITGRASSWERPAKTPLPKTAARWSAQPAVTLVAEHYRTDQ